MSTVFRDRTEAGRVLATQLKEHAHRPNVIVLGLPRGGVVVAFEVAKAIQAPLDVLVVRKLGVPGQEELAMGAIASGGMQVLNQYLIRRLGITPQEVDEVICQEQQELARRERLYHTVRPPLEVTDKVVILVDDGIATGSTMQAAISALRQKNPAKIIVAVPVAAPSSYETFQKEADEMVCLMAPEPFYAVGQWYQDFSTTTNDEVKLLLEKSISKPAQA